MSLSAADRSLVTYTRAAKESGVHGVGLACGDRGGDRTRLSGQEAAWHPRRSWSPEVECCRDPGEDGCLVNTHLFIG